ncbi:hypothetical protein [Spiroplasma endosymbiont of Aspidapion aeneum]|uniref:hypothetical protein n=1 Tax=Spiroplasma endosymbiont of Aspidapion aeneum TaxID=3066276 RepID=UPI00313C6776
MQQIIDNINKYKRSIIITLKNLIINILLLDKLEENHIVILLFLISEYKILLSSEKENIEKIIIPKPYNKILPIVLLREKGDNVEIFPLELLTSSPVTLNTKIPISFVWTRITIVNIRIIIIAHKSP